MTADPVELGSEHPADDDLHTITLTVEHYSFTAVELLERPAVSLARLAAMLHATRETRKRLAEIEALIERAVADAMPEQRVELDGLLLERRGGRDRKAWRNDDVAWQVAMAALTDPVTGEQAGDEALKAADTVRNALVNCAQITGWRVTQLRPLGIDPDVYCETTTGRRTVQVSAAAEAPDADE